MKKKGDNLKNGRINIKFFSFIALIFMILLGAFVFSAHTITTPYLVQPGQFYSLNTNESMTVLVNFSISTPGAVITEVNFTAPANIYFGDIQSEDNNWECTEISTSVYNCTNTSTSAIVDGYVMNFTVNASATADGTYALTITSIDNASGTATDTNHQVSFDSTPPEINLSYPENFTWISDFDGYWEFNSSDAQSSQTFCNLSLNGAQVPGAVNSTAGKVDATIYYDAPDGIYYWTVTCGDYPGMGGINWATSETFNVTLDTTPPYLVHNAPANNSQQETNIFEVNISAWDNIPVMAPICNVTLYNDSDVMVYFNDTATMTQAGSNVTLVMPDGEYGTYYYEINCTDNALPANFNESFDHELSYGDIAAPVVTLVSPADDSTTASDTVTYNVSASDMGSGLDNCTLYTDESGWDVESTKTFTGASDWDTWVVADYDNGNYEWNAYCCDVEGNCDWATSNYTITVAAPPTPDYTFNFNGTVYDSTRDNALVGANVSVTVYNLTGGFEEVWTYRTVSDGSGDFDLDLPGWNTGTYAYSPDIYYDIGGTFYTSKPLPEFFEDDMTSVSPVDFRLQNGAKLNITVVNATGDPVEFNYQVSDEKLGLSVKEDFENTYTQKTLYLPSERNYSVTVYPNMTMPRSMTIVEPADDSSTDMEFNTSESKVWVSGTATIDGGALSATSFHIIPFVFEAGNNLFIDYSDMPVNMSSWRTPPGSFQDQYNPTTGAYNITLPAVPAPGINILLMYYAYNHSNDDDDYMFFKNITLTYGDSDVSNVDVELELLTGNGDAYTEISQENGPSNTYNTSVFSVNFSLQNESGAPITGSAFVELRFDYTNISGPEFGIMKDVGGDDYGFFTAPVIEGYDVVAQVFAPQYAPKKIRISASTLKNSEPVVINLTAFDPADIDGTLADNEIFIDMIVSNSTCNVPNYPSSCSLMPSGREALAAFNPLKVVMGGGDISFVMGKTANNVTIMYKDTDLLASGPPDVVFDGAAATERTSDTVIEEAWRFGSAGPEIYDEVLIGFPYNDSYIASSINVTIPLLYDDDFNLLWNNTANGSVYNNLSGDYENYDQTWFTGKACSTSDPNADCYIDTTSEMIWMQVPHFSSFGAEATGMTPESNNPNVTNNQTNLSGSVIRSTDPVLINATAVDDTNISSVSVGYTTAIPMGNHTASDYNVTTYPTSMGCSSTGICVATINATDYWNNSNTSTTVVIFVDDSAPAPSSESINVSTNITNTTPIRVQVTATDVGLAGTVNVTLYNNTMVQMAYQGSDVWQVNTTPQDLGCAEGICVLTFNATDALGHSNNSVSVNVGVDGSNPAVTGASANDYYVSSSETVEVNISVTDNSALASVTLNGTSMTSIGSGKYQANITPGSYSCTSGACVLVFTAIDQPGNVNNSVSIVLQVDNANPTVSSASLNNTLITSGDSLQVNVTVTDSNLSSVYVGSGNTWVLMSDIGSNIYQTNKTGTQLGCTSTGTCTLRFNSTDEAGNTNNSVTTTISVDNSNPVVSGGSVNVTSAKNNTIVSVSLSTVTDSPAGVLSATANGRAMSNVTGTWQVLASGSTLSCGPEGTCTITFIVTDNLGNVNNTATATYIIDETAPTVSSAFTGSAGSTTATVSSSGLSESAVCAVNYGTNSSNLNLFATGTLSSTGAISLTSLSASTIYYFNVTSCTDAAGNANNSLGFAIANFTTSAAPSGGGGGGGGGGSYTTTSTIELGDLTGAETSTELGKGDSIEFDHAGADGNKYQHHVKVLSMGSNYANFEVASEPQTFTLYTGQSREVDLDGDAKDDIRVSMMDIVYNKALVKVTSLVSGRDQIKLLPPAKPIKREAVEEEPEVVETAPEQAAVPAPVPAPAPTPAPASEPVVEKKTASYWYVFGGLIALVVIILIVTLIIEKRRQDGSSGGM